VTFENKTKVQIAIVVLKKTRRFKKKKHFNVQGVQRKEKEKK
jgi:hypothetical protein